MPEKNVKKRNWALVAYPESLPADWLQILADTGLQVAVSPLHDSDVNPDGEKKRLIIISFSVIQGRRLTMRLKRWPILCIAPFLNRWRAFAVLIGILLISITRKSFSTMLL